MDDSAEAIASSAAPEATSADQVTATASHNAAGGGGRGSGGGGGGRGSGGGGEGPLPLGPLDELGRQDETSNATEPEGSETTPAFAPLAFDQSYAWMLQLIVLVAAMTMFFPFLRNLIGIKSKKRQTVNYSSYEFDEDEDCNDSEESLRACSDD